jgi:hypothetical protein
LDRRYIVFPCIFTALASIPAWALAQTTPAANAAGFVRIAPKVPTLPIERAVFMSQTTTPSATQSVAVKSHLVVPPPKADVVPAVRVRPKDAWTDDQGLRVSPSRVAYKRRF